MDDSTRPSTGPALPLAETAVVLAGALLVALLGARAEVFTIDSYYYLAKAKSLAGGEWLRVPWGDGIDRKFFWGYSLALALPLKLFGEAGYWVLNALLVAWTGLMLARIFRLLPLAPWTRLAALALAMFNAVAIWWATVPMSEALLVALASTAVLLGMRYRAGAGHGTALAAALVGGLSFLTRVEGVFVGLVLVALVWSRIRQERRWGLLAACALLFLGPELVHVGYLSHHAIESKGLIAYVDEARGHFRELAFFDGVWRHVRAPYWMVFRFDTEPWLYARFFPAWLTVAQGLVLVFYLGALAAALASATFRRSFAFAVAVGLLAFAALHSLWYYAYERYDYLVYPAAALLLAWGLEKLFFWAKPKWRALGVVGLALLFAAITGAYGVRLSQMHAERLLLHQGGRDFRAIARAANAENPEGRPVVTNLGPYLAFYLNGPSFFDRFERDFYDDVVPRGEEGRAFLARHRVAAIVSTKSPVELQRELALANGEFYVVPAPGANLLVLDLPAGSAPGGGQ